MISPIHGGFAFEGSISNGQWDVPTFLDLGFLIVWILLVWIGRNHHV